jgi:sugar lactone lactonase YvrE
MLVSDTRTEGRVYQISSEHHVRHEIQVHNAEHWRFYALQTEEERGESGFALPVEIDSSRDITFANFHAYRVISCFEPFPYAVRISNSQGIRFRNVHCYSNSKVSFDSSIFDQSHGIEIRQREFAWLDCSGQAARPKTARRSPVVTRGAKVEKLAGGFHNISGGASGPAGDFYFVDAHRQRIYRWAPGEGVTPVSAFPLEPVNLAVDNSGTLMVVSYSGNGVIYALKPGIEVLKVETVTNRAGKDFYLPVTDWRVNRNSLSTPTAHFISPDGTAVMPVADDFLRGVTSWGVKSSPQIRSFGLGKAHAGHPFYVSDEAELRTWVADVDGEGSLSRFRLFAEQGGEGVTSDSRGNVYIAAGQIYAYDAAGKLIDTIEVPERPLQLVFGGADHRTLFIPARHSLYSVRMQCPGE